MTHAEVVRLVELYALHALVGPEERWVESHIAGCAECEERLSVALTATASLVEDTKPPDHLWERILGEIEQGPRPVGARGS